MRMQFDERTKVEEGGKKSLVGGNSGVYQGNSNNNGRPQTAGAMSFTNQLQTNGSMVELQEKEDKIRELS